MSRFAELYKNTVLFSIATIATKFIAILMLPLYTFVFTTAQFGIIEVVMTFVNLATPVLILSINDAVLRFSLGRECDRSLVFSYGLLVGLVGSAISCPLILLVSRMCDIGIYVYPIMILIVVMSMYRILSYFAMGVEENRLYMVSNLVLAVSFAVLNVLLLVVFRLQINGYLISFILSNLLVVCLLFYAVDGKRYLTSAVLDRQNWHLLKDMTVYSLPLIANSSMWWVTNASDRLIVFYLLGPSFTGIYAVANKLPMILSSTIGIFNQAWQLTAIKEYNSHEKNQYYTQVYLRLFGTVLVSASLLIASLKPVLKLAVSCEYYSAWQSAHLLVLAAGLSTIAAFLGANYVAAKKNMGNMLSTLVGAASNVALNFLLIPVFGLRGAALSTLMSYLIVTCYRLYDTRKYVLIDWADRKIFLSFGLILVQIAVMETGLPLFDLVNLLVALLVVLINRVLLVELFNTIRGKLVGSCTA